MMTPRTCLIPQEPGEVPDHSSAIVRDEHPPSPCRNGEHFRIGTAGETAFMGALEIDCRLTTPKRHDYLLIEIGIG